MNRRRFLKTVIVASIAAPLTVNADERRYEAIKAKMRALARAHRDKGLPASCGHTMYVGGEAMKCFERGLFRQYGARVTRATDRPHYFERPYYLPSSRVVYSPHLGLWDVSDDPTRNY